MRTARQQIASVNRAGIQIVAIAVERATRLLENVGCAAAVGLPGSDYGHIPGDPHGVAELVVPIAVGGEKLGLLLPSRAVEAKHISFTRTC